MDSCTGPCPLSATSVFFRLGELLLPTEAETRALLKWGDITFNHASQPTLLKVHLHVAKCDQFGEGTDVFMGRTGNTICPIDACLAYVAVRGDSPGPFFMTQESRPLVKPSFVFEVRKALSAVGLQPATMPGTALGSGQQRPLQLPASRIPLSSYSAAGTAQRS